MWFEGDLVEKRKLRKPPMSTYISTRASTNHQSPFIWSFWVTRRASKVHYGNDAKLIYTSGGFWAIFKAVKRALLLQLFQTKLLGLSSSVCLRRERAWSSLIRRVQRLGPHCRECVCVCVCVLTRKYWGGSMYVCPGHVSEFVFSVAEMRCFSFFSFCVCVCSRHHNSLVQCGSVGWGSQRLGCCNSDTYRRKDVLTFLPGGGGKFSHHLHWLYPGCHHSFFFRPYLK